MFVSHPNFPRTVSSFTPVTSLLVRSDKENKIQSKSSLSEGNKERIKKLFNKVELSVSSYDTAWVAMIPSPSSVHAPLFPQCLTWLLDNQLLDGSWGLPDRNELLTKDYLLSTLACVLALKQWSVGEEQTNKGLQYIEKNIASAHDDKLHSPIGFDIIFSYLTEQAQKLDLNLPIGAKDLEELIKKRESELKRGWESNSEGWRAYLSYISEGMGKSQNWEMAMKYQRKNGSLFNSPATTAVAFSNVKNADCLSYINSLVDKFGNAVPTVYPLDVFVRLSMVDSLQKLGINRHFREEIRSIMDETYKLWQQREEVIFLEPATCAMAFRLLRLHGYDVSSDALSHYSEDKFSNTLQGYLKDVSGILELYKASEMVISLDELVLEEQNSWTRQILKRECLSSSPGHADKPFNDVSGLEIRYSLLFPHHTYLDLLLNRRSIELYNVNHKRILKTSYSSSNLAHKDFLELAVEDFNLCQSTYRKEFEEYSRWFTESRMDKLQFPRTLVAYSYLTAAGTHVSPELSKSRLSWAKNGLLVSVIDNFYDVWGCEEDQIKLPELFEKWDVDLTKECCSETVEILFLALKRTICDIADQAYKVQGRNVLKHLHQIWLDCLESFLTEAQWVRRKQVPTIDEFMANALTSFASGPIILPGLYLVGPKLSQEIIESAEYDHLYELVSLYGRFFNDINGYKRELEQGKLNLVALRLLHGAGTVTEEEIIKDVKRVIDEKRTELFRLVLQEEGSIVPRSVKDVYWKMVKTLQVIYQKEDVFQAGSMPDLVFNIRDLVLGDPIILK